MNVKGGDGTIQMASLGEGERLLETGEGLLRDAHLFTTLQNGKPGLGCLARQRELGTLVTEKSGGGIRLGSLSLGPQPSPDIELPAEGEVDGVVPVSRGQLILKATPVVERAVIGIGSCPQAELRVEICRRNTGLGYRALQPRSGSLEVVVVRIDLPDHGIQTGVMECGEPAGWSKRRFHRGGLPIRRRRHG